MTPYFENRDRCLLAVKLELFGAALDEGASFAEGVETVEPLLVFPCEVDGAVECLCPFEMLE